MLPFISKPMLSYSKNPVLPSFSANPSLPSFDVSDNFFHLAALRTESLAFRIREYIESRIVIIAKETIVAEIIKEATAKKAPARYFKSIKIEYDGRYLWIWLDFEGKEGEPLGLWFEKGTKRHKILPVRKKALKFPVVGTLWRLFENSGGFLSKYYAFSKGHWVRGIRAKKIFERGLKRGYPKFERRIKKETEAYLKETRIFG